MTTCHNRRLQSFCERNGPSVPHFVVIEVQYCEGAVCLSMFCGAAITDPSTQTDDPTIASAHLILIHENGCCCVSSKHDTCSDSRFCHRNHATITLPLECDCSTFRPHLRKIPRSVLRKKSHVFPWCDKTDAHLRKGSSTEHAQELSLQRVPCESAPSPVESLSPAPSCAGWAFRMAFHGCMKCHVISLQAQKCFSYPVVRFASNCCQSRSSLLSLSSPKLRRSNMIHSKFARPSRVTTSKVLLRTCLRIFFGVSRGILCFDEE